LIQNKRWISGLSYLWEKEEKWPKQPSITGEVREDDPESKNERKALAATTDEADPLERITQSFASWYQLKKRMAWILRYRANLLRECRRRKEGGMKVLIPEKAKAVKEEELDSAEREIVRHVQRRSFKDLSCLQNHKPNVEVARAAKTLKRDSGSITKSSSIYKMAPQLINGMLCDGGRLRTVEECSYYKDESRHPWILPKKHNVVELIVRHFHMISGHPGQEQVFLLVRKRFWIIKARVAERSVLSRCIICRRRQAPIGAQKMADLLAIQ